MLIVIELYFDNYGEHSVTILARGNTWTKNKDPGVNNDSLQ